SDAHGNDEAAEPRVIRHPEVDRNGPDRVVMRSSHGIRIEGLARLLPELLCGYESISNVLVGVLDVSSRGETIRESAGITKADRQGGRTVVARLYEALLVVGPDRADELT